MSDAAPPPAGTPPPPDDDDAYIRQHGDQRLVDLFEHKNSEAAMRRRELRDAQEALQRERDQREQLEREHESEQQRVVREAEDRGREAAAGERDELAATYDRKLAIAAIERNAAGKFADPSDAVRLLPLDELLSETDERKRDSRVEQALIKLLESKPYLAREPTPRPPLVTQGPRSEQRQDGRQRERSWLRS